MFPLFRASENTTRPDLAFLLRMDRTVAAVVVPLHTGTVIVILYTAIAYMSVRAWEPCNTTHGRPRRLGKNSW